MLYAKVRTMPALYSLYTQEDMTLLMNHINSVKRPGLGNKSPYELVEEDLSLIHIFHKKTGTALTYQKHFPAFLHLFC